MEIATAEVDFEALYVALDKKRRHLGLTRQDLAPLLGLTPMVISRWGYGTTGMSARAVLRICLWLERDLRDFAAMAPEHRKV